MNINKILIITYDWPPRNSIATHRPYSWAKYLSNIGFQVTVLTAEKQTYDYPLNLSLPILDNVKIITVPSSIITTKYNFLNKIKKGSKLFSLLNITYKKIRTFFGIEFDPRNWWSNLIISNKYSINTDFDLIISTYGPQSAHYIAEYIKKKNNNIKWIADYRDLWSISHLSDFPFWKKKFIMRKEFNLIVNKADLVTTVSNELAKDLDYFFSVKSRVILNGFDIEKKLLIYNLNNKIKSNSPLIKIVYTGMIYIGRRDPTPLFKAISKINNNNISVEFYGTSSDIILKYYKGNLPNYIECKGTVDRDTALFHQINADYVLLLESGNEDAKGVLTGKVFEYIASGTPILSIGSTQDSAIGKLLNYTGCGKCFLENIDEIRFELQSYNTNSTPTWYKPNINRILEFHRDNQASILKRLIDNL
jgi:hypothetical protein